MKKLLLLVCLVFVCIQFSNGQCAPTCPGSVNVSLIPNDCKATLSAKDFVSNISPTCNYKLELQYPYGTNTHSPAVKLDLSHQGYQFNYVVRDSATNNSCWGKIKVNYCDPCFIPTPPVVDSFKASAGPYIPGGTVTLQVWAHDNKSIKKVDFYNYGTLIGSDLTDPYKYTFTFSSLYASENHFWAIVYDDCGDKDSTGYIVITTTFPRCNDGIKNGTETGTDCGGSNCPACYTPGPIYALPDLVIKKTSPLPYTVNPAQWLSIEGKVFNRGDKSAPATIVKAALSNDTTLSSGDYTLGTTPISALNVNDSTNFNLHVALPNWKYGYYYLLVCVDPQYDILEYTKSNNCFWHRINFEEVHEPDLVTTYLAVDKDHVYEGDTFKVSYMVKNIGDALAGSSYSALYLSDDNTVDYGDIKLSEQSVAPLSPDNTATLMTKVTKNISSGHYYLIACADTKNQVWESNENNNCSYIYLKVQDHYVSLPDLTASYLSVNKNHIAESDPFSIAFMINNQSNTASGASKAGVYLSDDKWLDGGDDKLSEVSIPALPANQSVLSETGIYSPIHAGNYYLFVCADIKSQVAEESENNNCTFIALSVGSYAKPKCDLEVDLLEGPVYLRRNEPYHMRCRIRNIGHDRSQPARMSLGYHDNNSNFIKLHHFDVLAMEVNAVCDTTIAFTITNPDMDGVRTLTLCADDGNNLDELDETNNCMAKQVTIIHSFYDLKNITAVSFSKSHIKNDTLAFPFAMTNAGNLATDSVEVDYYLSFKPFITSGSAVKLLRDTIGQSIQAGDTLNKNVKLKFPDWIPAGSYYINICIDYTNKIKEESETNNCQSIRITLANPVISGPEALAQNNPLESRSKPLLDKVSIYPNPAINTINIIGIEKLENYKIHVLDIQGKLIQSYQQSNTSIPISHLAAGVYILRLSDGADIKNIRFIKQ